MPLLRSISLSVSTARSHPIQGRPTHLRQRGSRRRSTPCAVSPPRRVRRAVPCDILPVPPRDLDGPRLVQEVRVNLRIQRAGLKYGSTGEVASASSIPDSASTCARAHLEFGLREMLGPRRRFASLVCLLFMVVVTTAQWDAGEEIGTEMKIARGRYARLQRISFYLGLHEDHWAGDSSGVGRDAKWRWISTRQRAHCPCAIVAPPTIARAIAPVDCAGSRSAFASPLHTMIRPFPSSVPPRSRLRAAVWLCKRSATPSRSCCWHARILSASSTQSRPFTAAGGPSTTASDAFLDPPYTIPQLINSRIHPLPRFCIHLHSDSDVHLPYPSCAPAAHTHRDCTPPLACSRPRRRRRGGTRAAASTSTVPHRDERTRMGWTAMRTASGTSRTQLLSSTKTGCLAFPFLSIAGGSLGALSSLSDRKRCPPPTPPKTPLVPYTSKRSKRRSTSHLCNAHEEESGTCRCLRGDGGVGGGDEGRCGGFLREWPRRTTIRPALEGCMDALLERSCEWYEQLHLRRRVVFRMARPRRTSLCMYLEDLGDDSLSIPPPSLPPPLDRRSPRLQARLTPLAGKHRRSLYHRYPQLPVHSVPVALTIVSSD